MWKLEASSAQTLRTDFTLESRGSTWERQNNYTCIYFLVMRRNLCYFEILMWKLYVKKTCWTQKRTFLYVLIDVKGALRSFCGGNYNQKRDIFTDSLNKIKTHSLFPWLNKQIDLLCIYVADPATSLASNRIPGTLLKRFIYEKIV